MSLKLVVSDPTAGDPEAPPPGFSCSWTDDGPEACWVRLDGGLDAAVAWRLERTLNELQLRAQLVVLDLRELVFIDLTGVRAVRNASVRARLARRRLVLLRGPPEVDRMFALAGGSDRLEIGDLDRGVPPLQLLLHLDDGDLAS